MAKQSRCSNFRRRLAARILKCGLGRIWFNPNSLKKINQAITRSDIRKLILNKDIKKKKVKRKHSLVVRRKQRKGSRKGTKSAREGKKKNWLKVIRPQRRLLKEMKKKGTLVPGAYRKLYMMTKSGSFRSKAHLLSYIKDNKLSKEEK